MQVDWTVITIVVITFAAINGLFKGWWREAITTLMLAGLLFLLQQPELANQIVTLLNRGLNALAGLYNRLLGSVMPLSTETIQLGADDPLTWFVILFVTLGTASLLGRLLLPGGRSSGGMYAVQPIGHVLGFALGAFNGYLVLSLAREYLDGRALPGNAAQTATAATGDFTVVTSNTFGEAAKSVAVQAVNLPDVTIMDSIIPWLVVAFGAFILMAMFKTRVVFDSNPDEGRKVTSRSPYGYKKVG
jgi:hypothetical protein